jgi:hypothetical protein
MSDKFVWRKFAEVNVNDTFFDSLKADYVQILKMGGTDVQNIIIN